jgi:hypothetical protein
MQPKRTGGGGQRTAIPEVAPVAVKVCGGHWRSPPISPTVIARIASASTAPAPVAMAMILVSPVHELCQEQDAVIFIQGQMIKAYADQMVAQPCRRSCRGAHPQAIVGQS